MNEQDIRRALRRESPAPGFADRVMRNIEAERPRPVRTWWRAAAASVALVAVASGWAAREAAERRREEGERAREQVMLALQIAGSKVRIAQQEVRSIGSHD